MRKNRGRRGVQRKWRVPLHSPGGYHIKVTFGERRAIRDKHPTVEAVEFGPVTVSRPDREIFFLRESGLENLKKMDPEEWRRFASAVAESGIPSTRREGTSAGFGPLLQVMHEVIVSNPTVFPEQFLVLAKAADKHGLLPWLAEQYGFTIVDESGGDTATKIVMLEHESGPVHLLVIFRKMNFTSSAKWVGTFTGHPGRLDYRYAVEELKSYIYWLSPKMVAHLSAQGSDEVKAVIFENQITS